METDNFYSEKKGLGLANDAFNHLILLRVFLILLLYIPCTSSVLAQQTPSQRQVARPFTFDFHTPPCYGYLEYLPENYSSQPNSNFPVVIFLHGVGECGNGTTQLWNVARNGPPLMVKNNKNFPFILISPQSPSNEWWQPNTVNKLVDYVVKNYRVDSNRIYITGLSYGGYGTWGYAGAYPNKIAAAVPISGCGNINNAPGMKNLALWAFHNEQDNVVNSVCTTSMIDAIKKAGGSPLMTLYPKFGHDAWTQTYNDQNMWDWLLGQTKDDTPVNIPPVANAGADVTITLPTSSVNLTGTGSDKDGSIKSYTWTKQSGPAATMQNASTANVTLSDLTAGTYVFRLTVKDNLDEVGYDEVKITVKPEVVNQAPVANAGSDQTITLPTDQTNLVGSGTDNDGSITAYLWTQKSGPNVTVSDVSQPTLSITALLEGTYVFELKVTDDKNATAVDEVIITVQPQVTNQVPTANAGGDQQVNLPTNSINITGSGSDSDGSIVSYLWTKKSGPGLTISNAANPTVSLTDLEAGIYVILFTVTDDSGATAEDELVLTVFEEVVNQIPSVNSGDDRTLVLPNNSLTINGSASDPDGYIATYLWTKESGPSATLSHANTIDLSLSDLVEGEYVFRLTVTDDKEAISYDEVAITVLKQNMKPVVDAGIDIHLTLPDNDTILTGSATDADGSIVSYLWRKNSGPSLTLGDTTTSSLAISDLVEGTYSFTLIAKDDLDSAGTDEVEVVVVNNVENQKPTVNAGVDIVMKLPEKDTVLQGEANDFDGTIASYLWRQVSGPAIVLGDTTQSELILSNLVEGTYVFRLIAMDNLDSIGWDEVEVKVLPANKPPVVNAGKDVTLYLPVSSTNLIGRANDTDGKIILYSWTQVSGPVTATITNATKSTSTVSNLVKGVFVFRLRVKDDLLAETTDDVKVTVLPDSSNQAPKAYAGSDKTLKLPINSLNLIGSGTDADGSIVSYAWVKKSGPSVTITNANKSTVSLKNLVEGKYIFTLTVTDNKNATGKDDVIVTVNPAEVNQAPTANAGPNKSITLPTNTLNITGIGTDPEGQSLTYNWTQKSGIAASLTNFNKPTVTISNLAVGTYVFRFTVKDKANASAWDEVTVTVNPEIINQAPSANAGDNIIVTWPRTTATLYGSGSDPDGSITTYQWTKVSGPDVVMVDAEVKSNVELSSLSLGEYVFRLTVTDNKGATDFDDVTVLVNQENKAPVVNAGSDIAIALPINAITIQAIGSDEDGTIDSYLWTKRSGGTASMANTDSSSVQISNLVAGSYTFRVSVTDNQGKTAFDDINITVNPEIVNQAPTADAGEDLTIVLPVNSVVIKGSGTDADGTVSTYNWIQTSGATAVVSNENSKELHVSGLTEGNYEFKLTVTDDKNATGTDEVKVFVKPKPNVAPIADAGKDLEIDLPETELDLIGKGEDEDGTIVDYFWEKVDGPSFTSSVLTNDTIKLSNLVEGTYTFRLTVADDKGATNYDDVIVKVNKAPNQLPVITLSQEVVIQLPLDSLEIVGSAEDADGQIVSVLWTKEKGPNVSMLYSDSLSVKLFDLEEGVYSFKFSVTDNEGGVSSASINVKVEGRDNQPPLAIAGQDTVITDSEIVLMGAGIDNDGSIISYRWKQTMGGLVTLDAPDSSVTKVSGLTIGKYIFELTVMDNDSALAYDQVEVSVEIDQNNLDTFIIPKVLTPNGDGKNDTWFIQNLNEKLSYHVIILNSSGIKVFEANPYQNDWDGNYNGKTINYGDYYYIVTCNETKEIKRGGLRVLF